MPEDKFDFSPEKLNLPGSDFKGVRHIWQQLKHVAASNYLIWCRLRRTPLKSLPGRFSFSGEKSNLSSGIASAASIQFFLYDGDLAINGRRDSVWWVELTVTPTRRPQKSFGCLRIS